MPVKVEHREDGSVESVRFDPIRNGVAVIHCNFKMAYAPFQAVALERVWVDLSPDVRSDVAAQIKSCVESWTIRDNTDRRDQEGTLALLAKLR